MLLLISTDERTEPRFQVTDGDRTAQIFGVDVDGARSRAEDAVVDAGVLGYPIADVCARSSPASTGCRGSCTSTKRSSARRPHGEAAARPRRGTAVGERARQPVQRAGEDAHRSVERRAGAHLARQEDSAAPGSARHEVREAHPDSERSADEVLGPADVPRRDGRAARGLGQPTRARATRSRSTTATSSARRPGGARRRPIPKLPPADLDSIAKYCPNGHEGELCTRYGYERMRAGDGLRASSRQWTAEDFPRVIVVIIQHANPYYDDSYAVNSENLGPYGDAITHDLIPYIEQTLPRPRPLGARAVRRLDRRLGGARRAGPLPGRLQRRVGELPRPDRLPRATRPSTSTTTRTRIYVERAVADGRRAPASATTSDGRAARWSRRTSWSWCSGRTHGPAGSGTSGRRSSRRSGPTAIRSASGTSAPA